MTGVYEIKCVKNGKRYVGVSKDIKRRWREHRWLLYRGEHHSYDMQCDYNKFGENCFEFNVLKSCDYPEAKAFEEELIQSTQPDYNSYTNGKGIVHNCIGKEKECEAKVLKALKPYFTDEFNNGEQFIMVDLFRLSQMANLIPTKILRYMRIDRCENFEFRDMYNQEYIIGVLPTNDGLYVTLSVNNERAHKAEDYYYVGE